MIIKTKNVFVMTHVGDVEHADFVFFIHVRKKKKQSILLKNDNESFISHNILFLFAMYGWFFFLLLEKTSILCR
jgi:hypothetical protein